MVMKPENKVDMVPLFDKACVCECSVQRCGSQQSPNKTQNIQILIVLIINTQYIRTVNLQKLLTPVVLCLIIHFRYYHSKCISLEFC